MDQEVTGGKPSAAPGDLAVFVEAWRQQMQDEGVEFVQEGELDPPRDGDSRADLDWE
jgi:hypothetical protein